MKLIQISDLHIDRVGELVNKINTSENFLKTLHRGIEEKPDLVVLTGDLCHNEVSKDLYYWIKQQMDATGLPYYIIGGNHDNPAWIREIFYDLGSVTNYFAYCSNNQRFIFLDTADGSLGDKQLTWLKLQLRERVDAIFMHHPPVFAGVPYFDTRYAFREIDKFAEIVRAYKGNIPIFCGHYHTERTVLKNNMQVFITPSCFLQIDYKSLEFEVDHYQPAYRVIDFLDSELRTWVNYML